MVSFTHEQNIICSQTKLDDIVHEQTIICRQLFAGHVVGSEEKFATNDKKIYCTCAFVLLLTLEVDGP